MDLLSGWRKNMIEEMKILIALLVCAFAVGYMVAKGVK